MFHLECPHCQYRKALTQRELDVHVAKIHKKTIRGDTNRQAFLLTFFDHQESNHYEERDVNGFVLVKNLNKQTGDWQVSIYTPTAFAAYLEYKNRQR